VAIASQRGPSGGLTLFSFHRLGLTRPLALTWFPVLGESPAARDLPCPPTLRSGRLGCGCCSGYWPLAPGSLAPAAGQMTCIFATALGRWWRATPPPVPLISSTASGLQPPPSRQPFLSFKRGLFGWVSPCAPPRGGVWSASGLLLLIALVRISPLVPWLIGWRCGLAGRFDSALACWGPINRWWWCSRMAGIVGPDRLALPMQGFLPCRGWPRPQPFTGFLQQEGTPRLVAPSRSSGADHSPGALALSCSPLPCLLAALVRGLYTRWTSQRHDHAVALRAMRSAFVRPVSWALTPAVGGAW